jgi:OHCU decarboxylase
MTQTREEFVGLYGGIYEHSAWVAEEAWDNAGDYADIGSLPEKLARCVDDAPHEAKLALIRAHPDLAGKAAIAGELTEESTDEQAAAGIDQCTPEEFARFQALNAAYKQKFGFPFVMAVRNSNRHNILEAFTIRLENDNETEFATAISEIHKIARLRLEATDKP